MPIFQALGTKNRQTGGVAGVLFFQIPRISGYRPASARIAPWFHLIILRSVSRKIEIRKVKRHGQAHWI
jgi:hypothetical protein